MLDIPHIMEDTISYASVYASMNVEIADEHDWQMLAIYLGRELDDYSTMKFTPFQFRTWENLYHNLIGDDNKDYNDETIKQLNARYAIVTAINTIAIRNGISFDNLRFIYLIAGPWSEENTPANPYEREDE